MWGDLAVQKQEETPDEGFASLIELIPPDRREDAESMLRGFLSNVRSQLSPENYRVFCANLKQAWNAHTSGDQDTARSILAAYGLPYDMLVAQLS